MKTITLGDFFDFKNGLNADKSAYGSGLPFVNVMDIFNHDVLSVEDIKGVVEVPEKLVDAYRLRKGDILFNRTSEIPNEIAFSTVYVDMKPAVFGGFVIRAREKEENFDLHYKKYFFQTQGFRRQAIRYSQGAVRGNIGQVDLAKIQIPLPPLPTQRRIAAILQTWDRAIQLAEQQLADLQERKRGLMQLLLTGKKRLPEFEGKEEWREVKLGDVFKERKETGFDSLPLLSIGAEGVYPQTDSNKRDISNSDKSKYKRIVVGDIGYNTMRMWQGRSALSSLEGIVSPAYTIISARKGQNPQFWAKVFQLPYLIDRFWRNSQGLVDDTLNCRYNDLKIVIAYTPPSLEEQNALSSFFDKLDNQKNMLESRISSLRLQKRGLMQRLLEGEVEVGEEMDEMLGI